MNAPAKRVRKSVVDRPTPPKAADDAKVEAVKAEAVSAPWWHKIRLLDSLGNAMDFYQSGWNMRTNGLTTIGLVRMSDGAWVLPPVKCKEYVQDTLYAKHIGKDISAYGYTAKAENLKQERLALVIGVPKRLDFLAPTKWALERGIDLFQLLTDDKFSLPVVTITGRTFKTKYWGYNNQPMEQDMVVVEYDEQIENHPALFSAFITCLRAGSAFVVDRTIPSNKYGKIVSGQLGIWCQNFSLERSGSFDYECVVVRLEELVAKSEVLAKQATEYSACEVYKYLAKVIRVDAWHTSSGLAGFAPATMLYRGESK